MRVLLGPLCAAALIVTALLASTARAEDERDPPLRDLRDAVRSQLPAPGIDAFLGVVVDDGAAGVRVRRVVAGSAARTAGVRAGDVLRSLSGRPLRVPADLDRAMSVLVPGERIELSLRRDGRDRSVRVRVRGRRRPDGVFRGSAFRLGVVPLRFADDDAPADREGALQRLLFEATGKRGSGASLTDYFADQSHGGFEVFGRVFASVPLRFARARYADQPLGAHRRSLYHEATAALVEREGARELRDVDGLAFVYTGVAEGRAGRALWPHRSTVAIGDRDVPYYVHPEATEDGRAVGGHCHEFAHLLGLADAYGAGHRTGCGDFCLMSIGHRGGGRSGAASPFSLCVWCRMRLGWLVPVRVDPRTPQRLRLPPVDSGRGAALLLPFTRTSDAFVLLENRRRTGFDRELSSEGLLVWRVGCAPTPAQGRYGLHQDLVEAHGIDVFDASLVRTREIAFPTDRARDLTPETRPPLWAGVPEAFEIHLTRITQARDGSIHVTIGVPRRIRQRAPAAYDAPRPEPDGAVIRRDPITGTDVRFRTK